MTMNAYYTIEDWSLAKWLYNTNSELDHRQCDIVWAKQVLSYFKLYIKIAKAYCRHYVGSWGEAIRYLWNDIRSFSKASDINALLTKVRKEVQRMSSSIKVSINETYAKLSGSEFSHGGDLIEFKSLSQKSRSDKSERLIRRARKTNYIISSFAFGIATL